MLVGVGRALTSASANYDVSDGGTLVHVSGAGACDPKSADLDRSRGTHREHSRHPAGFFSTPRLSPDDQRVLLAAGQDIRVFDLATGRETRLTSDARAGFPAWRADGAVAYTSSKSEPEGTTNVWLQLPDGGTARRLTTLTGQVDVDSWSPDGKLLAVHHHKTDGDTDVLMVLSRTARRPEPRQFAAGPGNESGAMFSPDGRYVGLSERDG